MLTRQTGKGTVMEASERLSRQEALQTYTEYGAYSQKAEGVKGRLVPGQWADIAVSTTTFWPPRPKPSFRTQAAC